LGGREWVDGWEREKLKERGDQSGRCGGREGGRERGGGEVKGGHGDEEATSLEGREGGDGRSRRREKVQLGHKSGDSKRRPSSQEEMFFRS